MYFASLLAGSLGVIVVDGAGLTGGASGAVFGLMACAAVGLHRRGVNVFSTGIGTTLLLNLVLTFTISGISIGGHMGGVIAGGICGWVMLAPAGSRTRNGWSGPPRRSSRWCSVAVTVGARAADDPGRRPRETCSHPFATMSA